MLRPAPSQGAEGDDHNFPVQPIMDSVMSMLTRIPTRNSEVISKQNSSQHKSLWDPRNVAGCMILDDYETFWWIISIWIRINKYVFVFSWSINILFTQTCWQLSKMELFTYMLQLNVFVVTTEQYYKTVLQKYILCLCFVSLSLLWRLKYPESL